MASAMFYRATLKRPWVSLAASAATVTTGLAFGLEGYADRQERQVVAHHHGKTTAEIEEALAAGIGLPRSYDRDQIRWYWLQRPISVLKRFGEIAMELGPVVANYYIQEKVFTPSPSSLDCTIGSLEEQLRLQHHAEQLLEALTNLGPAWVKGP